MMVDTSKADVIEVMNDEIRESLKSNVHLNTIFLSIIPDRLKMANDVDELGVQTMGLMRRAYVNDAYFDSVKEALHKVIGDLSLKHLGMSFDEFAAYLQDEEAGVCKKSDDVYDLVVGNTCVEHILFTQFIEERYAALGGKSIESFLMAWDISAYIERF